MFTRASSRPSPTTASVLVEINLVRAWWILVVSTTCTVLFTLSGRLTGTSEAFSTVQALDYAGSSLSVVLFWLARWGPGSDGMRRVMPYIYTLFFVVINDCYYFSAWPVAGDNVGFAFGALTPAALMYLRPVFFTPLLVGNYIAVCWLIVLQPAKFEESVSGLYGATIVSVIAVISSIFHYRSKVAELEKTELLAKRNLDLAASNSGLLALSQRMDEMMATAAHDLRSPLLGLAQLCELQLTKGRELSKGDESIFRAIRQDAERMVSLVNTMVSDYAARQGAIEGLVLETCDLDSILREVANRAEPLALRKNIDVRWPGFSGPAVAEGNPEALERIFGNLLSNAIKYSPEGTRVELGIAQEAEWWLCEVRDEGPGIPEAERSMLFNKLQRGTNQPTSGEESTGLGLYSAKKLVESLGGQIEFEPRAERGSIFRVKLKAVEA